ncbi:LPS-assembly protein [Paracoccus homiensis]|uniref:LPS-assembly protein LptD n=2 Tax=Paracoccus homiensis TaxID=364199 RepID=A0A1I0A4C0_9RHOB|nr:LPS-assembly protein [Paracoccus homiensis]
MNRTTARTRLMSATVLAGLTWIAAMPAQAQDIYGQDAMEPDSRISSAPLDGRSDSALAPSATRLSDTLISDGTNSTQLTRSAEASRDITLPADMTGPATPEDAATVLADSMYLQDDSTLIASGGVVVWYQGARLVADRLVVDGQSGALTIEGPIHLSRPGSADPDEDAILIADSAQLDRELQDGIIRGARLMLNRELQLAASQATRSQNGRITRLDNVVTSACTVCAEDPVPLWSIRARSVTHDAETRLLHLEHPQLRVAGVPVAAVPFTITAPDPSVERQSGFLRPSFRTTSNLGFGIKLPYFRTLGDSADVTVTPYVSASRTRTLELRYRQAFARGEMEWNGAVTRDDIREDETRGYLFGAGRFDLPRGYTLGFQVQAASDRAYLLDYDVSDADRLWSGLTLERVTRDKLVFARVGNYHSLRDDEDNSTSPTQIGDALWINRFSPRLIGGEGALEWSVHAHRRPSDTDIDGRDVVRGSLGVDWRRSEILPGGVVAAALMGFDADIYHVAQDSNYEDLTARAEPMVGVELRWPLMGQSRNASHIVEPVAQILWSPNGDDDDIPNEDSRLIEFDEGNLFSADRFPGWDARETGLRANLGVSWTRIAPTGWSLGVTAGRVFRADADNQFPASSPLSGRRSDWLLSATYDSGTGLAIANRALFDDSFSTSRNELRIGWLREDLQVSAGHIWIASDEAEDRDTDTSELTAEIGWQIAPGWWGNAETRYDFAADSAQMAALDVTYRNECIAVEMGLSRRFTDSDSFEAETSFDLSVRLGGFGRQDEGFGTVARRSCMR